MPAISPAAEWQFFSRAVEEFRQTEWWVRDKECSVGTIDQVVRTIEPLAFEFVGQHADRSAFFETRNSMVAVLVYG
jgi:hypothetical protein